MRHCATPDVTHLTWSTSLSCRRFRDDDDDDELCLYISGSCSAADELLLAAITASSSARPTPRINSSAIKKAASPDIFLDYLFFPKNVNKVYY